MYIRKYMEAGEFCRDSRLKSDRSIGSTAIGDAAYLMSLKAMR